MHSQRPVSKDHFSRADLKCFIERLSMSLDIIKHCSHLKHSYYEWNN